MGQGGRARTGHQGSKVMFVGAFTGLGAVTVPVGSDKVITSSYNGLRDTFGRLVGGATYVETNAVGLTANAYTAQTANGRWFILAEDFPTIDMFGAVGDAVVPPNGTFPTGTDNTSAINSGIAYCCRAGLINCLTLLIPCRSYLFSSITIDNADLFELRGMGEGSMLATTASAHSEGGASGFAIKIKDSARCKLAGFCLAGNSNQPDGVILENNGLHSRTTSSMTCNTVWIDFNGMLQGPSIYRCIYVIDNQAKLDNNDFNDFHHSRCFNYAHSAVTLASCNSLVNVFPKLCYNSYSPKATTIYYLETLSVMRDGHDGQGVVEQGGGGGVVKSGTRMVFAGGLFGSAANAGVVAFYLRGRPLQDLQIEGLIIEDQAALLDVDYSTATNGDGARFAINFANVELKGGVGVVSPANPLPFITGRSCPQVPMTLSFVNSTANQGFNGRIYIGPNIAMYWTGGIWSSVFTSGLPDGSGGYLAGGSLTVASATSTPGTATFDATISTLLMIDFRGAFVYGANASINGAGRVIEYGDKTVYGNLSLPTAGRTISFTPPVGSNREYVQAGSAGPFVHGSVHQALSGAPTTLSQMLETQLTDRNTYTMATGALSLPANATRIAATKLEGVWYGIPLYRISNSALFAARANNTGNGSITGLSQTAAAAGEYLVRLTSATAFSVTAPGGASMAAGVVGTPYTDAGLSLTVNAGGTAFVSGDSFVVTV
ncbi:MAG: hypothetical protein EBR82_15220 [Caulobacteraceae bacterium]|nr:hypothetical protein [Caulobacteraceae bacterium]